MKISYMDMDNFKIRNHTKQLNIITTVSHKYVS